MSPINLWLLIIITEGKHLKIQLSASHFEFMWNRLARLKHSSRFKSYSYRSLRIFGVVPNPGNDLVKETLIGLNKGRRCAPRMAAVADGHKVILEFFGLLRATRAGGGAGSKRNQGSVSFNRLPVEESYLTAVNKISIKRKTTSFGVIKFLSPQYKY